MNSWNLSGEVIRSGVKGKQYPKLWLQVAIPSPRDSLVQDNKVFITFDSDANPNSRLGKIAEYIKATVASKKFIFVSECMIAPIRQSRKLESGEWENYDVTGIRGKLPNITLSSDRFELINLGIVKGLVIASGYDEEKQAYKFVVEERYRTPIDNKWRSREIPMLYKSEDSSIKLDNRNIFVTASLCGTTTDRESKTFGWTNKIILL